MIVQIPSLDAGRSLLQTAMMRCSVKNSIMKALIQRHVLLTPKEKRLESGASIP